MNFKDAIDLISLALKMELPNKYDGIIVKKLVPSNTLDAGRTTNQTHIAITGTQMDMFPYLMANGYFNANYDSRDEVLKKYFVTQIPFRIYESNVKHLLDGEENTEFVFNPQGYMRVRACIMRSRREAQADQVQLSLTTLDDKGFISFRRIIHAGDYFVLLKHKEHFEYDCFAVKESDIDDTAGWNELNNSFLKLQTNTTVDVTELVGDRDAVGNRKTGGDNILLYGVPGAGKSFRIQEKYCSDPRRIERVVFHPDYTYSDFVGQILPRVEEGQLKYVFTPGPFTKMLKKAWDDPWNDYYLIVEEINRGNAPAIFGEIFQLLDRKTGDRYPKEEIGESEYGISNYDIASIVYGHSDHEVRIPSNMYVLATMNTADQNVFTLDTAFQRRWKMQSIKNDIGKAKHAKAKIEGTEIGWGAFATVINDIVIDYSQDMASTEDKRLGAYFVKLNELTKNEFPEKVLKYLWDDAFKLNKEAVFNDKVRSLEEVIETYETTSEDRLKAVLRMEVYQKMIDVMAANNDGKTE